MSAQINYWVLRVRDTSKAADFFGPLMGWTFSEPGSAGGLHVMESEPWGGLGPLVDGREPSNGVSLAFSPDSIEDAVAKVSQLGGTVISDDDGGEKYGRWVECQDNQGTPFALFDRR